MCVYYLLYHPDFMPSVCDYVITTILSGGILGSEGEIVVNTHQLFIDCDIIMNDIITILELTPFW